jgi:predicted SAM-dependent methyltransferase
MKIHLGCGEKKIDGFVNVDIRDLPQVDVVDDIRELSKFKDACATLVYVSHVLEHISRREYKKVLLGWRRLLVPGGTLRLAVPDFEAVVNHYLTHKNIEVLRGFLYGGQTYPENYHYCAWDFYALSKDLEECGFVNVRRWDWRKTEHSRIDDFSQCYLPHMDKENGTLMSLNVEATKQ